MRHLSSRRTAHGTHRTPHSLICLRFIQTLSDQNVIFRRSASESVTYLPLVYILRGFACIWLLVSSMSPVPHVILSAMDYSLASTSASQHVTNTAESIGNVYLLCCVLVEFTADIHVLSHLVAFAGSRRRLSMVSSLNRICLSIGLFNIKILRMRWMWLGSATNNYKAYASLPT